MTSDELDRGNKICKSKFKNKSHLNINPITLMGGWNCIIGMFDVDIKPVERVKTQDQIDDKIIMEEHLVKNIVEKVTKYKKEFTLKEKKYREEIIKLKQEVQFLRQQKNLSPTRADNWKSTQLKP